MPSTRIRLAAAASCVALIAAGCGDDDAESAASVEEYCDLIEELDGQEDLPSEEQLTRLKEIRPDAIGAETDAVADAFIESDGDVGKIFSDPEMEANFAAMEEHDVEACGFEPEGGGEEGEEEPETEPTEGAQVVPVSGVDFGFEGLPASIGAGPVSFEFSNDGESAHEMVIFQLGEGVDLDALLASDEEPSEDQAREVGGTFGEPGGAVTYANTDLEPGEYAVICFIPGPGGKPHYELGMKSTFTVE